MDRKTEYIWTGKQNIYGQENRIDIKGKQNIYRQVKRIYMDRKTEYIWTGKQNRYEKVIKKKKIKRVF